MMTTMTTHVVYVEYARSIAGRDVSVGFSKGTYDRSCDYLINREGVRKMDSLWAVW